MSSSEGTVSSVNQYVKIMEGSAVDIILKVAVVTAIYHILITHN